MPPWNPTNITYRQMRARRALLQLKDVPLRTRRALLPLTLYSNSTLLVLNGTSLICNSALLALSWRYLNELHSRTGDNSIPHFKRHISKHQSIRYWRPFVTSAPLSCHDRFTRTNAHAHQCCIFQLCEDCTVANEIDYAWTSIHDNRQGGVANDVILQQRIVVIVRISKKFKKCLNPLNQSTTLTRNQGYI